MSAEHAFEMLTHPDVEWRRQGRELASTVDGEVMAGLFDLVQRGNALTPSVHGMTSELVEALATSSDHASRRQSIETIAPFAVGEPGSLDRILAGFPALYELRIVLPSGGPPPEFQRGGLRRLWIACARWTADEFVLPDGLESLALYGHGSYPELKNTESLRELETGQPAPQDMLDALGPQLERLHTRGEIPVARLTALRDLRCDHLTPASFAAELEHVHVERSVGRDVLDHPCVGAETRIRVDRWFQAVPTLRGERRVYWAGPVGDTELWHDILPSLPALTVVDLGRSSYPHPEPRPPIIPPSALPSPNTLWQREHERPYLPDEAKGAVVASWAARGRAHALRSLDPKRPKIRDIKHARTLSQIGLRDAKVLVEALYEGNFVALTAKEAATWQAWFRLEGCATEMTQHT